MICAKIKVSNKCYGAYRGENARKGSREVMLELRKCHRKYTSVFQLLLYLNENKVIIYLM